MNGAVHPCRQKFLAAESAWRNLVALLLTKLKVLHGRGGRAAVGSAVGKKAAEKIVGVTEDPMEKVEEKAGHVQATVRRPAKG
jgi:hypothetical protein